MAASPRALRPSIRFLFILSVFRLRLPSPPHYCDAVVFGYLIPPCQRLIEDFHPSYVSCLTYL